MHVFGLGTAGQVPHSFSRFVFICNSPCLVPFEVWAGPRQRVSGGDGMASRCRASRDRSRKRLPGIGARWRRQPAGPGTGPAVAPACRIQHGNVRHFNANLPHLHGGARLALQRKPGMGSTATPSPACWILPCWTWPGLRGRGTNAGVWLQPQTARHD